MKQVNGPTVPEVDASCQKGVAHYHTEPDVPEAQLLAEGGRRLPLEISDMILCFAAYKDPITSTVLPFVCQQWRNRRTLWSSKRSPPPHLLNLCNDNVWRAIWCDAMGGWERMSLLLNNLINSLHGNVFPFEFKLIMVRPLHYGECITMANSLKFKRSKRVLV